MPTYLVFKEGSEKILRKVTCPQNCAVSQLAEGEFLIEGDADDTTHKIVGNQIVPYTEDEQADRLFLQRVNTIPRLQILSEGMSDADLDIFISDYFLNRIDVQQWRLDNYSILRKQIYPLMAECLDAQIKLSSLDINIQTAGQAQLDQYNMDCLAVKDRFPKA